LHASPVPTIDVDKNVVRVPRILLIVGRSIARDKQMNCLQNHI